MFFPVIGSSASHGMVFNIIDIKYSFLDSYRDLNIA